MYARILRKWSLKQTNSTSATTISTRRNFLAIEGKEQVATREKSATSVIATKVKKRLKLAEIRQKPKGTHILRKITNSLKRTKPMSLMWLWLFVAVNMLLLLAQCTTTATALNMPLEITSSSTLATPTIPIETTINLINTLDSQQYNKIPSHTTSNSNRNTYKKNNKLTTASAAIHPKIGTKTIDLLKHSTLATTATTATSATFAIPTIPLSTKKTTFRNLFLRKKPLDAVWITTTTTKSNLNSTIETLVFSEKPTKTTIVSSNFGIIEENNPNVIQKPLDNINKGNVASNILTNRLYKILSSSNSSKSSSNGSSNSSISSNNKSSSFNSNFSINSNRSNASSKNINSLNTSRSLHLISLSRKKSNSYKSIYNNFSNSNNNNNNISQQYSDQIQLQDNSTQFTTSEFKNHAKIDTLSSSSIITSTANPFSGKYNDSLVYSYYYNKATGAATVFGIEDRKGPIQEKDYYIRVDDEDTDELNDNDGHDEGNNGDHEVESNSHDDEDDEDEDDDDTDDDGLDDNDDAEEIEDDDIENYDHEVSQQVSISKNDYNYHVPETPFPSKIPRSKSNQNSIKEKNLFNILATTSTSPQVQLSTATTPTTIPISYRSSKSRRHVQHLIPLNKHYFSNTSSLSPLKQSRPQSTKMYYLIEALEIPATLPLNADPQKEKVIPASHPYQHHHHHHHHHEQQQQYIQNPKALKNLQISSSSDDGKIDQQIARNRRDSHIFGNPNQGSYQQHYYNSQYKRLPPQSMQIQSTPSSQHQQQQHHILQLAAINNQKNYQVPQSFSFLSNQPSSLQMQQQIHSHSKRVQQQQYPYKHQMAQQPQMLHQQQQQLQPQQKQNQLLRQLSPQHQYHHKNQNQNQNPPQYHHRTRQQQQFQRQNQHTQQQQQLQHQPLQHQYQHQQQRQEKKRLRHRYCSARDPAQLAFEAPTVFEGKIVSMTSDRITDFEATFEVKEIFKQQIGYLLQPYVRLQFEYRNGSGECDIYREQLRPRGLVRSDELEQGRIYLMFVQQIDVTNFTILGQPIRKTRRVVDAVKNAVSENYAQPASIKSIKASNRTVEHGKELRIVCRVQGRPPPKVTWFKDHKSINRNRKLYTFQHYKKRSELIIKSFNSSDAGRYECRAKNKVNRNLERLTIEIKAYSVPSYEPPSQSAGNKCPDNASEFCFNGGTCKFFHEIRSFSCICPEGFVGERCDSKEINNKSPSTYSNEQECGDKKYFGSYYC